MDKSPTKRPELLAPAGDLDTALAAFESGADAVYAGLSRFNARERTRNFSVEEYAKLIAYARSEGKKVYLTLNTLVMDRELPDVTDFLITMSGLRPHAIIVQDFGILRMIREHFPELPVHASTQMAVHNSAGVNFLAEKGVSRVILERQVTLDELRLIQKNSKIELEVFIHGALCCSLSGVCLFSSWMGGWSGNRGKCKQPCRRRYFSQDGNGFFFSTKDLYTLDLIPELKRLGIASLKIEGRLRQADYVRPVVEAYRLMLDTPDGDEKKALKEARGILNQASGRQWSTGFFTKKAMKSVINHTTLGSQGQWVGDVKSVRNNGFFMKTSQKIFSGDKIRVQPESGAEGPSFIVTLMKENNAPVRKSEKQSELFIHCDKTIPDKGKVFRIGSPPKYSRVNVNKIPAILHWIRMKVQVDQTGILIRVPDPPLEEIFHMDVAIQPAEKHPIREDDIIRELRKLQADGIGILSMEMDISGELFIQNRDLRKMRQTLAGKLGESLGKNLMQKRKSLHLFRRTEPGSRPVSPLHSVYLFPSDKERVGGRIVRDLNDPAPADERLLPLFCPEQELESLKDSIQSALRSGVQAFRVGSLYGFQLLKEIPEIHVSTGFSLPVANSMAFRELTEWGAETVMLWPELDQNGFETILHNWPDKAEIFVKGRLPILITRADIPVEGPIRDSHGGKFIVEKSAGLTCLYPDKEIINSRFTGHHRFSTAGDRDNKGTTWNLDREWM